MPSPSRKTLLVAAAAVAVAALLAHALWTSSRPTGPGAGFASGNGRIEATEIDIATKLAGRVEDIFVREGDFVAAGEVLASMQIEVLDAQLAEAQAQSRQAQHNVAAAEAQVAVRRSDTLAAEALVVQRESELDAAERRFRRSDALAADGASSVQELDDDRARTQNARAAVSAARAQVEAAQAAVRAAEAQVVGAASAVEAAEATIARIRADIVDSRLVSPRDGRVQFRVAQPGEVLAAGGRVLNLIDLSDVYMTFFLPTREVGRIGIGSEARIVLDAAPGHVIPASISFVSSTAQFTPRSVETASEREQLMFRVRAQVPQDLLREHLSEVKTGLPGRAWVRYDPEAEWPDEFAVRVPE